MNDTPERYRPNGTPLTDHEREILGILQEECAEVIVAASKLIRFGKENRPDGGVPNTEELGLEVGDLLHMMERASRLGLLPGGAVAAGKMRKAERLRHYLQTEPPSEATSQ